MKEKRENRVRAEGFVSVKEAAHILRISPKTIYNKLWKREFPLEPIRLPWNRRDLFFDRGEVQSLLEGLLPRGGGSIARLLGRLRQPARPALAAVYGRMSVVPDRVCLPMLRLNNVEASGLRGWRRRFDLLLVRRRGTAIFLASDSVEHFRAAAFLAALMAVGLDGQ
jgi:predicted DNA-binding transcriptional regulator AlpA